MNPWGEVECTGCTIHPPIVPIITAVTVTTKATTVVVVDNTMDILLHVQRATICQIWNHHLIMDPLVNLMFFFDLGDGHVIIAMWPHS